MTTADARASCRICGSIAGNIFGAREMMYGTREPFRYFECDGCGCLQLIDIPSDMSPYYPKDYYSFNEPAAIPTRNRWKQYLNEYRNSGCLFGHDPISWILSKVRPGTDYVQLSKLLRPSGIRTLSAKILDVGCGSGDLLNEMANAGFRNLTGVDPFASPRTAYGGRLRILSIPMDRLEETGFDLIMSHHSLEHMAEQTTMLKHMCRALNKDGVCLIRVPVASSEVWRKYRENWVELDPPRHLVIHTQRSFEIAATEAGLRLEEALYDDTAFGYWGSEMYRNDIPLTNHETRKFVSPLSSFDQIQIDDFERAAQAANARQEGGRAAFYLRKV